MDFRTNPAASGIRMPLKLILPALTALAALVCSAAADLRLGVVGPATGQFRLLGEQMKLGAELAVAHINAAGGVNGERIVLESENDLCDADRATAVANQMVGRNVVAVIGHLCSAASIAASKVYTDAAIVQISPASTSPAFTDARPDPSGGTYRLYGREDDQAKVAGRFIAENFAGRRVAFVHDGSGYGKGLADETRAAFEAAGGVPNMAADYQPGQEDYSALVAKLAGQRIDLVFLGGYYSEAGIIARQLRRRGMKTVLMGGDSLLTRDFAESAGAAADGTLVTFPRDPRLQPDAGRLVDRIRRQGTEPEPFTLHAYAAVQIWAQAAARAGSTGYAPVSKMLNEGRFETVIGMVAFDSRGDMATPGYVVYRWRDGWYAPLPDQSVRPDPT